LAETTSAALPGDANGVGFMAPSNPCSPGPDPEKFRGSGMEGGPLLRA
jgi:hypothetical protein